MSPPFKLNDRATLSQNIEQNLFALPKILFCSWIIDGIFKILAASIIGTDV